MRNTPFEGPTNLRIQQLRNTLLHQTIVYNINKSEEQRKQKYRQQSYKKQEEARITQQMNKQYLHEQNLTNRRKIQIRNYLSRQYDRQIINKQRQKHMENARKQQDAKLFQDHNRYEDIRRMRQLQRIYKRKSYHALLSNNQRQHSLSEQPNYYQEQNNKIQERERIKTQESYKGSDIKNQMNYGDKYMNAYNQRQDNPQIAIDKITLPRLQSKLPKPSHNFNIVNTEQIKIQPPKPRYLDSLEYQQFKAQKQKKFVKWQLQQTPYKNYPYQQN